jgi:hypothetical protein
MVEMLGLPGVVEPAGDLIRVEPHESPDLQVGQSPFGDLSSDVADGDAEVLGELVDGEQVGERVGGSHGVFLFGGRTSWMTPGLYL